MFDAEGTREYQGKHGVRACCTARNLSTFVMTSELVAEFNEASSCCVIIYKRKNPTVQRVLRP
jgi:hypothetical protein